MNSINNKNDIIFYEDENDNLKIEVLLNDEDVWLNTNAIAELFGVQRSAIVKHINNIYTDEELKKQAHVPKWNMWVMLDYKRIKLNIIILI